MAGNEQDSAKKRPERIRIGELTRSNTDFRRVVWTGKHSQIVVMAVPVGEEIGDEVHETTDQILNFFSGVGEADLDGTTYPIASGDEWVVPAGTQHNFRNTGNVPLLLSTVYSPPEHTAGAVYPTREVADAAEESGEDRPPASTD